MRGLQERGAVAALSRCRHRPLVATVAVAAVVIAADQATTSWALAALQRPEHLVGPLGFALQYNSGSAFSLFTGAGNWIVAAVMALLVAMCWLAWRARRLWVGVAYGLVLGGALGNLADRLFRGHHGDVVDFVTLSHWPTFNLADAAITVGVVTLIVMIVLRPASDFHHPSQASPEPPVPARSCPDASPRAPAHPPARRAGATGRQR